jgi:hypothetical protein
MDGGLSPSPSGSSRSLSALLDQQQEPFSLHIYLLEKGCSHAAFLDAASSDDACSTCWPWRTAGSGRTPAASRNRPCASGVLRLLLCKVLRGKVTRKKKQLQPGTLNRQHHVDGDERVAPGDFERSVSVPPRRVKEEEVEENEDGDSELEQSPPVQEQSKQKSTRTPGRSLSSSANIADHVNTPLIIAEALLIFRELLQAAYSPTLFGILADAKDDGSRSSNRSKGPGTETPTAARNVHEHCEEEDDAFDDALAEATAVAASDMAGATRVWPGDMRLLERRDVGADTAAAVLDALVEETATELMNGDGRPRFCG